MQNAIRKIFVTMLSAMMILLCATYQVKSAENDNLAYNKPATASSFEIASTDASKAVDGDLKTRWGTAQNKAINEWLEVDLGEVNSIRQINLIFERSDAEQNILGYKVEIYHDSAYETIITKNERVKQNERIVLPEAKDASRVKVTILNADGGTLNWVNVGLAELEVYDYEKIDPEETENVNHVSNAVMTASSVEDNLTHLVAAKANDGDKETRWASDYTSPANQWLKASFAKPTKLKQINLYLFERNVDPKPSNIAQFSIKYVDQKGVEKYAVQNYENTSLGEGKGYQTNIKIILDEAIIAQSITVCEFNAEAASWNNVSITELEAYSNEINKAMSLDEVVNSIQGKEIASDVDTLPMPSVPEGFDVKINGADFEQIVADNGTIVHPLTDKLLKISFEVTELKSGNKKLTNDLDFTIKGKYVQAAELNAKPVVMPELAEWHTTSNKQLAVADITSIVYDDAKLKTVVDEFVRDYKQFTGIELSVKQAGTSEAGAFNFMLKAPDSLLGSEGYTMNIKTDRIDVSSVDVTGNMYGMQSILQMYKQNQQGFHIGDIRDYPRFVVRGFLLDVARKPISMQMLKDISRTMRYYKMNDFQIHLSDNYIFLEDYGSKEEELEAFKAYDAFRLESSLSNDKGETPTATDYAYSKAEFKNFILEERAVGVKIVPEIDVPAHANSFTKIWPEIMVQGKVSSLNSKRPLIDHIDVSKPEAVNKVKEIFDDYTKGDDATFDEETTVHIGADEFLANYTAYRNFINTLVPYVKETNTVRMWGGLTWIDDGKTEIEQDAIENVEMNIWSSSWADGLQMYNMGYKTINTIDDYTYMVPNGSMARSNAYGDLLNINRIFDSFEPHRLGTRSGYKYIPSGDDQAIGAAFAMWHDNIDKRASGLSESDLYWRFFDAMPFFAEKTWAATGKEKGSATAVSSLAQQQGIGPNINPYFEETKTGDTYGSYDFENGLNDSSQNDRDLIAGSAEVKQHALALTGGNSYVQSPIQYLGNGNTLSFDITLTTPAKPGQILFEADAPYGTHDIRILSDGTLGFTRELYEYSFGYELPVGKTVNVRIETSQQKTALYINDDLAGEATGKFIHNDMVKKTNITNATFALPLQRIGSSTNAVKATIDNIVIAVASEKEDVYNKSAWTGKTNSETVYNETEGLLKYAFDNNPASIWHSNWKGASDKLDGTNSFYAEIDFHKAYTINQFSFTPRQSADSGYVTKADLFVKLNEGDEWKQVAADQIFAADGSKKTFEFEEQEVRYVKYVAKDSNDGWVAVSEFDINNKPASMLSVYVQSDGNGMVTGTQDVKKGEMVTVTATPNTGYVFDGWYKEYGDKVSDQATYTFVVNSNTALTARFIAKPYVVTIDGVAQDVKHGDLAQVEIPVKPGHKFLGFFEDGSDTPFDFTKPIERDVTVTSKFVPYNVAVNSAPNGVICIYGMNDAGEITLEAKANEGYTFAGWYADNELLSTEASYTFVVEKDMLITPVFKATDEEDTSAWRKILTASIQKAQDLEDAGALIGVHEKIVLEFKASLKNAVDVLANEKASNEQLFNAWMRLAEAMQYLDFKADKTQLSALVSEYNNLDLSIYEDDGNMEEFLAAKADAQTVLDNPNALQDSIDAAYNRLLTAKSNLQLKIDTVIIDFIINNAEKVMTNKDMYDTKAESWSIFEKAYAEAKAARKAMESQEAINAAAEALADAYANVRLIANEDVLSQLKDFIKMLNGVNMKQYVKEDVALFNAAKAQIQSMIDDGSFTMQTYEDTLALMAEVNDRIENGMIKPTNPIDPITEPNNPKQPATKPGNPVNSGASVDTSDRSNSIGMLFGLMLLAGMAGAITFRKNKKEYEK